MGKSSFNGKCNAIHLEQWMKGQLDNADPVSPVIEQIDEDWTEEMLRKRSEELQLIDSKGNITASNESRKSEIACEELILSDQEEQSPSKSTTTESQVTVRSSPLVPETVPVCRQCHKNCLSNVLASNKLNQHHHKDCSSNQINNNHPNPETISESIPNDSKENSDNNDWQGFLLLGICANPVANLVKYDPFNNQQSTPKLTSVAAVTPESSTVSREDGNDDTETDCICPKNTNLNSLEINNKSSTTITYDQEDISPDDSPQTEEHPYHSLSSSAHTLRRFGTVSSLERCGSDEREEYRPDCYENHCSSEESDSENDDYLGIDNEAFNHSSILSWTARAGNYVAEKMAFFEKLGEDCKNAGGFFERYLKPSEDYINGEETQEEETSGGTSGEEVWGTPTSGGDLDDPPHSPNSPNFEGKLSPNNGSYSSDNMDDTELMMDELLMAPPISGAILRGLLPRRTLEPLIEEDFSDTSSSSPSSDPTSPHSGSSEQGNRSGSAADTCSRDVADLAQSEEAPFVTRNLNKPSSMSESVERTTSPEENAHQSCPTLASECQTTSQSLSSDWEEAQRVCEDGKGCCSEVNDLPTAQPSPSMPRSESYRKIVEAAEDAILEPVTIDSNGSSSRKIVVDPVLLFENFRPAAKFVNVERVPRTKSIRIFEFFNVRRTERRIYERFPENRPLMRMFTKENILSDSAPRPHSPSRIPPKGLKDNRNGRFWRQLSRRRNIDKTTNPA